MKQPINKYEVIVNIAHNLCDGKNSRVAPQVRTKGLELHSAVCINAEVDNNNNYYPTDKLYLNSDRTVILPNNNSQYSANFSSPHKTLDSTSFHDSSNQQELHQKSHTSKKYKAARLVHASHDLDIAGFVDQSDNADNLDHDKQSLSALFTSKTITVLINFLKLSKYDDEWLKIGKQLLLLKRAENKQICYRAALSCFKSAIKVHPDNFT